MFDVIVVIVTLQPTPVSEPAYQDKENVAPPPSIQVQPPSAQPQVLSPPPFMVNFEKNMISISSQHTHIVQDGFPT